MNYRPPNFELRELVPPSVYKRLGEKAWTLLNEDALRSLQAVRDKFGPIVINSWHVGGSFTESGLREPESKTGAKNSAHKRGMAFDCKPRMCLPQEMYDYILDNQSEFPLIRRVENIEYTPTWVHIDVVPHNAPSIRVFKP